MTERVDVSRFADRLAASWPPDGWRELRVLVAVSGGADSMALLRGVLELKQRAGGAGAVYAAHVNHQLRREASDADAQWLRRECERLKTPILVQRANVERLAAAQGDGLEAAGRAARYLSLTAMAEEVGARFVAFGHTRDDQVETILFRLLRGTGLRGLAGIPAQRRLSASVSAVRPLLGLTREEVLAYLEAAGQPFREDASNRENRFTRNRVRHELLPLLRDEFNTEVDASLVRLGGLAADAQAVIDDLAAGLLDRCRVGADEQTGREGDVVLSVRPLKEVRQILAAEVLRGAWREAGFPEQGMTRQWWRRLAEFAQRADAAAALNLPGNIRAERREPGVLVLALRAAGLP